MLRRGMEFIRSQIVERKKQKQGKHKLSSTRKQAIEKLREIYHRMQKYG